MVRLHTKIDPVPKEKILFLISLLSKYSLFHVRTDKDKEFNATTIVLYDDTGYLEFKRCFATSVYSKGYIIDIAATSTTEFVCKTPSTTYFITCLHSKSQDYVVRPQKKWNDVFDLMDISFIGNSIIFDNDHNLVTLVVDPYLLGELSSAEEYQIRFIINVYLGGYSNLMQVSRTVYFQVRLDDKSDEIYAGIYDLENESCLTKKLICDTNDRVQKFIKCVKEATITSLQN